MPPLRGRRKAISLATGIKMPQAGSIFGHSQLPLDYWRGHILNATCIEIRRLGSADAAAYREIRLAGLRDSPEAFGSTFVRENAQPLVWFCDRLRKSQVLVPFGRRIY